MRDHATYPSTFLTYLCIQQIKSNVRVRVRFEKHNPQIWLWPHLHSGFRENAGNSPRNLVWNVQKHWLTYPPLLYAASGGKRRRSVPVIPPPSFVLRSQSSADCGVGWTAILSGPWGFDPWMMKARIILMRHISIKLKLCTHISN